MSVATSAAATPGFGRLPVVLFFEADEVARHAIVGLQRCRRLSFDHLDEDLGKGEWVMVTSSEHALERNQTRLRSPNVRVIALSDMRFHDPRLDTVVYAYLPPNTPAALLERMIDNALDHMHLLLTRRQVNERLGDLTREVHALNQIGAALSAEHDTGKLLEMILTKSREVTRSDAGALYIVEKVALGAVGPEARPGLPAPVVSSAGDKPDEKKLLRFKLVQNDTVEVPFRETTMEINERSIAGYVAMAAKPLNIEDAYHLGEGVPYRINRKFDEDSGYRTKSILAVPMVTPKGEVLGVVQLINAKRDAAEKLTSLAAVVAQVVPYTHYQQEMAASLASQAAVALENSRLYAEIQAMLEGFVRASVIAIEARDPTTSGHSFRVANLTVALAESVDRIGSGPYADLKFSRTQMKEIRYASLLHDFGKVGVREEVLVKAKKLYPAQIDLLKQRFDFVKRTLQTENYRRRLDYALEKGRDQFMARLPEFDRELEEQIKSVDDFFSVVLRANEPSVLPEGHFEQLLEIAARRFGDYEGNERSLLSQDEAKLLSIRKGSLDEQERQQIESHVVHSFNFLSQIPWTREIRGIPAIARGHHEKLNGLGYPYKLSAPHIPVQTRMMTISDIFDALAAADRPYKKAVPLERALEILELSVKDGELDPHLFEIFLEAKVFERWKIEPYPY